jgi:tryptophan 2,3-dioxygenase
MKLATAFDEVHFILVHQVSELWFKLILRELRLARDRLILRDLSEHDVRFVIERMARASDALVIAQRSFEVAEQAVNTAVPRASR